MASELHLTPLPLQVARMKTGLKQLHADLAASTPGTPVTEADLTWAIQAVRSRAFSGPYAGGPLLHAVKCHCSRLSVIQDVARKAAPDVCSSCKPSSVPMPVALRSLQPTLVCTPVPM